MDVGLESETKLHSKMTFKNVGAIVKTLVHKIAENQLKSAVRMRAQTLIQF